MSFAHRTGGAWSTAHAGSAHSSNAGSCLAVHLNALPRAWGTARRPGTSLRHGAPSVAATPAAVEQAPAARNGQPDVCIPQFPAPAPGAFVPNRSSFHEQHRIRGYEVAPNQRATIVTMTNLLQEVAGNHAVGMWGRADSGFAALPSMDIIFVMTRLQLRMHEYPKWGDIVQVETYFTEEGRLAARRDWVITDAATGKQLGAGTSTWVTINLATRRFAKLPEDVKANFMRFSPKEPRHAIPAEHTKRKLEDCPEAGTVLGGLRLQARRNDMDMNGHINNVSYVAWALGGIPDEVYDQYQLDEIEVDFKAECLAGDEVEALSYNLPAYNGTIGPRLLHTLRRITGDGGAQEIVRCRTSWVPLQHA